MKNYVSAVQLKKAALLFMAQRIPEKNVDELRRLFIQIDKDGDGIITTEEFKQSLKLYGVQYDEEQV